MRSWKKVVQEYVLENAGNNIRILIYFINIKTMKMKGYDQNILIFGNIRNPVFKIQLLNLFKRFNEGVYFWYFINIVFHKFSPFFCKTKRAMRSSTISSTR